MTSSSDISRIDLEAVFSDNLAFRQNADRLFDDIRAAKADKVTLDFTKVMTMSRSFAHQYLQQKNKCSKNIHEIGMREDVVKMLEIAKSNKVQQHPLDFSKMSILTL
jgi:hypothetical protein